MFVLAPAALAISGHAAIRPSADSDAEVSLWGALLPAAVGLLLIRMVPPTAPVLDPLPGAHAPTAIRQAWALVAVAVAFPVGVYLVRLAGVSDDLVGTIWVLAKPVAFLLVPWLLFRLLRPADRPGSGAGAGAGAGVVRARALRPWRPAAAWRWLAPLPALAAFAYLHIFGPLAAPLPSRADYPDLAVLIVGAAVTVLTANVLEEVFYRMMLQSRLEVALGRWPGIVAGALLFALLHLPTHDQGGLPLTLGAIVAFQGVFGLFTGYLWARYRNAWVLIAAHSAVNTVPLLFLN